MGWWQVNADTLARSRFVVSSLAEATAGLMTLKHGMAARDRECHQRDRQRVFMVSAAPFGLAMS
jgi:hypothetical protein